MNKPRMFHPLRYEIMQFNKLDPVGQPWELKFLVGLFLGATVLGVIFRFWM